MGLFNFFTQEIAIDLGTANTLIIHNDKVVVDEPSIVAFDRTTNKVIAIGRQAMQVWPAGPKQQGQRVSAGPRRKAKA